MLSASKLNVRWTFRQKRLPLKRVQPEVNINKQQKTESCALFNTAMTDKSLIAVSPWPPPMAPLPKTLSFCCRPEELRHHWSDDPAVGEMTQPIGMESRSHGTLEFCLRYFINPCFHSEGIMGSVYLSVEPVFLLGNMTGLSGFLTLLIQESPNFFVPKISQI